MMRSNDHANMLRLISSIVCGSQISRPTPKPTMMIAPTTQLPDGDAHDLRVRGRAGGEAVGGRVREAEHRR